MKTVFLNILLLALFIGSASAQTVNGKLISELDAKYVEIVGYQKILSNKVVVSLQFGQLDKIWSGNDTPIKDSTGRLMVFNSMIDAMNFLSEYDYRFCAAYAVANGNGQNVYHYLMERKDD